MTAATSTADPLATLADIAIPEELRPAWARVEASKHEPRMMRALARVASGESYRQAAEAEDYADHARVWRLAKRYGLLGAKKAQILAGSRRVALLANEELERRLVEKTEEISDRDLTVMGGVAQDKLAAAERRGGDESGTGGIEALVAKLLEGGGTLSLKVKTPDPVLEAEAREALDVTPGAGPDS